MGDHIVGENWRDWFKEWGSRFLLFSWEQAGSMADAEDILQQAMLAVWSKRDQFPEIRAGRIFTHIRRVAINRARTDSRRKSRKEIYATDQVPLFENSEEVAYPEVEEALRMLPLEQREVIVLKIWGEQTFESIGGSLDISPNTAASRYRYGLDRLRKSLEGELS
jgi:RNA polymerase sigma-70 factor (ECF subfamily)